MRYTVHKWFWVWDFEKEENWLNEMSVKGLQLVAVGFCKYVFEETIEGEYAYKLELLENVPSNAESISYISFLEETGVEYIGSLMRWAYFRKKVAYGDFEIYSDIDSKIKHYKRIRFLILAVTSMNVVPAFSYLYNYIEKRHSVNFDFKIFSFLITLLLGFGILKVSKKISKLKKEKAIRE
ncbi:DUF2812 domain-containing protein [Clostridium vincentii]|uniref:DUF2812 domain-containing protein n=1 Tax=Clostridium vincentii TaxID=52704 RepID=A0A2T0BDT0_9CLOT|nr:DUF2812 domain-containing protein [Clostridium vincentii]PRR82035.1 hypothetical protein CLVI_21000 [Clostridium vincentii]